LGHKISLFVKQHLEKTAGDEQPKLVTICKGNGPVSIATWRERKKPMIEFIYQILAKVGFNHPLHPPMTHLPMGMIMGGFLFGLTAVVFKKKELAKAAHYCYTLALIFVLPTMILGYMDWQYKLYGEWSNLIVAKIILAFTLTGMLVVAFVLGRNDCVDIKKRLIAYALCLALAIGLGFIGGTLQYG
jgi:uncharacterized membrane protein